MSDEPFGDVLSLTTFDGKTLVFDPQAISVTAYGSFGAPPTDFQTRRGYKQDGATEVGYTLAPRNISLNIHQVGACDRQAYWDNRLALHEFLRPNRNGPITMTLVTPNGDMRSLVIRAEPGFIFPPVNTNNWDITEDLDFVAFDPIWFASAATEVSLTAETQTQLIFPITFPIVFGTTDRWLTTGTITYDGTWRSYPTITLTGPYTRVQIKNITTGAIINLNTAIVVGETRIITLTPGAQTITDASGNNRFSELGPGSDLINFNLRPNPEVANGQQEITAQFINGTTDSTMLLTYYERYFAL